MAGWPVPPVRMHGHYPLIHPSNPVFRLDANQYLRLLSDYSVASQSTQDQTVNIGRTDQKIRLITGLVAIAAALFLVENTFSEIGWGILVVGLVLTTTALLSFCPVYKIFNISTRKSTNNP
ncbi:MAG: DUF2892 domain-containing protein [Granulosicoccus sp.]|nr:DUF2892 domain-containing protein [Granulosicoccus sp.]